MLAAGGAETRLTHGVEVDRQPPAGDDIRIGGQGQALYGRHLIRAAIQKRGPYGIERHIDARRLARVQRLQRLGKRRSLIEPTGPCGASRPHAQGANLDDP